MDNPRFFRVFLRPWLLSISKQYSFASSKISCWLASTLATLAYILNDKNDKVTQANTWNPWIVQLVEGTQEMQTTYLNDTYFL